MREFFRGWKRKAGLVTLVLACVFAAGWVRSLDKMDDVDLPDWGITSNFLRVCDGEISLNNILPSEHERAGGVTDAEYESRNHTSSRWCGFAFEQAYPKNGSRIRAYTIPFWALVIPLTLLSAWLLLNRSKQLKPTTGTPESSTNLGSGTAPAESR